MDWGQRIGDKIDSAVSKFRHDRRPRLVAWVEVKGIGRRPLAEHPGEPVRSVGVRLAQHVVGARVALAERSALQDTRPELQSRQVIMDAPEIFVAQFPLERCEQRSEALGLELGGMFSGDVPQPSQPLQEHRYQVDRAMKDRARKMTGYAPPVLSLCFDRLHGEVVELSHHRRVLQALLHDRLPVQDRVDVVGEPREKRPPRHLEQERIAVSHGAHKHVELQVLAQGKLVGPEMRRLGVAVPLRARHVLGQDEIPITVHQERLHALIRSLNRS